MQRSSQQLRDDAQRIWGAGVAAVQPRRLVPEFLAVDGRALHLGDDAIDLDRIWRWIWMNLWTCLKERPRLERRDVLPSWKEVWSEPKREFANCQSESTHGRLEEHYPQTF